MRTKTLGENEKRVTQNFSSATVILRNKRRKTFSATKDAVFIKNKFLAFDLIFFFRLFYSFF